MKTVKYISCFLLLSLLFTFCKKKNDEERPGAVAGGGASPVTLVIDSFPEKNGSKKDYLATIHLSGNSPARDTIILTFTITATIIGDTTVLTNIPAKKYLFISSHQDYSPIKAYSYVKNNSWYFITQKYSPFVGDFSVPLPITLGQKWGLHITTYDTLSVEKMLYVSIKGESGNCLKVYGQPRDGMVDLSTYYYSYYLSKKGTVKMSHSFLTIKPNSPLWWLSDYDLTLLSSNF